MVMLAGCEFSHGALTSSDGRVGDGASDGTTIDAAPPHRIAITIDGSKVQGTQTQFPVWIDVTSTALVAGAKTDGSDLHFTDAGGTALPFERVRFDATTGHLLAWVRLDLAAGTSTKIYLRFGDAGTLPTPSSATVFAAYAAVWHLDDKLTTTAVVDARGTYPGTAAGLPSTSSVTGPLANGFDFDGSTSRVTFTNPLAGNTPSTISAWVSEGTASGFDAIVTLGTNSNNGSRFLYAVYDYPTMNVQAGAGLYGDDWDMTGITLQNGGWKLLHWTYAADKTSALYVNGVSVGTHTFNNVANTSTTNGWIGYAGQPQWGSNNSLNGQLDEVRIARTSLTPEWIATEYANQSSPSTFYSVGAAEP